MVRSRAKSRRRMCEGAFTLVELLVVIAIIGVLVSLLMPAIQAAREAARRIQCQNHLKQLSLAVSNYADTMRVFPASGIVNTANPEYDPKSGTMFSWAVLILPYMEQANLHSQFNFNVSVLAQSAAEPQAAQPPVLLCPSDIAKGRFLQDSTHTNNKRLAKGNYAAWVSPVHVEFQTYDPGALTSHASHTHGMLAADGTSMTLMLTEVLTRQQPQDQRGAWAIGWNGATLLALDMHHGEGAHGYDLSGYTVSSGISFGLTQRPNTQGPNLDMIYDCVDPADAQFHRLPCNNWEGGGTHNYLSSAPRSRHPGGVNVVFVDGHVGFLTDQVDEVTLAYLISIEDGRAVQLP